MQADMNEKAYDYNDKKSLNQHFDACILLYVGCTAQKTIDCDLLLFAILLTPVICRHILPDSKTGQN